MKFSRSLSLVFLLLLAAFSVHAKDEWTRVQSKNFLLVGNASEKDIRKVATRLEQFRETFRLLFAHMNLTSPIQTNVVVFKNDAAYKNFKPKRADGSLDTEVSGFFQPGEDVNYITLSTGGEDEQTFATIFHEYVHFIVNTNFGKSEVPPWFNEGLAEYYSTFSIADDGVHVKLGFPRHSHLYLLQENRLMPLAELFKVSNYQLLQSGGHSRSIFYAESWAIVHYLIQTGKTAGMNKFLDAILKGDPPEKAFQAAFQMTYATMEAALRKYVSQNQYTYDQFTLNSKLTIAADMQSAPLDEADTNAYLGDLLYHSNRADDAEPFLLAALKLRPDSGMANITLGMVKIKQRKFAEARAALEKAIAGDPHNHIAFFRYAYLLSRESQDEFGFVQTFDQPSAVKMRNALKKAIVLNPSFTESYELLAFVDVVNNEQLDEAAQMMQSALKYQPGNQRYSLRLAEIFSRQGKLDESEAVVTKIAETADEPDVRTRAGNLLNYVKQKRAYDQQLAAYQQRNGGGPPSMETGRSPSDAELARRQSETNIRSINAALRPPGTGEQRLIGRVQKIDCRSGPVLYTIKAGGEIFTLTSKDFDALVLNAFDGVAADIQVGCSTDLASFDAVITFRPAATPRGKLRGDLVAVEFVPSNFRLMNPEEMRGETVMIYQMPDGKTPPGGHPPAPADAEARRRAMMLQAIKDTIRKPAQGQKRDIGFLDRIECTAKGSYLYLRTSTQTLRLLNTSPEALKVIYYTPDLNGLELGCTSKPIDYPAVFVYSDAPDAKAGTAGEILSLEFVPKSFVLD